MLMPFNIRSLTLFYIPTPNYIRYDTLQTINALSEPETLLHLLFFTCVYSKLFWKDFEFYFYSLSKQFVHIGI